MNYFCVLTHITFLMAFAIKFPTNATTPLSPNFAVPPIPIVLAVELLLFALVHVVMRFLALCVKFGMSVEKLT